MVIRVSSNLTFYIKLEPQRDTTLHSKLKQVHVVYDNYTEEQEIHDVQRCQFVGHVIAPVKGVASVNTCPNSLEAVRKSKSERKYIRIFLLIQSVGARLMPSLA